ncbi:SHOOT GRAVITROPISM 6-like protein, partial [Drosera capensis]
GMDLKMRASAFAAFGALSAFAVGAQREVFLEQVHAVVPRLVLHLHDDDMTVRQACRNTLKKIVSFLDLEGNFELFSSHFFNSDHRSDYEDFVRDLSRRFTQHLTSRIDAYLGAAIQAYDAPWPIIQANAIHFSCSLLSQTDDQRILSLYYTQVFGLLVSRMSRSSDATVRATCSSALGMLLKSSNSLIWRSDRLEHGDSTRRIS